MGFIRGLLILTILFAWYSSSSAQSSKLIENHFAALNKHDVQAITEGYAENVLFFSVNWEGSKIGLNGVKEVYSRYFSSTPDLNFSVTNIIYAGDNIIVEYVSGGTFSKPEDSSSDYMKGKKYSLNHCVIFTIKNDKIVKESDYFDQVAFLRQVGFFDQK